MKRKNKKDVKAKVKIQMKEKVIEKNGSTHVILIYWERLEEYEKEEQKICECKSESSNESKSDSKGWKHACNIFIYWERPRQYEKQKQKYVKVKVKVIIKVRKVWIFWMEACMLF